MTRRSASAWLGLWLGLCGCGADSTGFDLSGVGFATPECVVHDDVADVYLVSNIAGDPFAKDGNGFISRVWPDGIVHQLRWIDGAKSGVELNAPKGMALHEGSLWVTDIDTVRRFDRRTGAPTGAIRIDGATFLNDIAIGPDGGLYVTDSGLAPGFAPNGADAIWRIAADELAKPDPKPTVVCRSPDLGQPNGIAAGNHDLFCVTWGSGAFALVDQAGLVAPVALPAGQLDGLVRTADGRWFASSWEGKCVYEVMPSGEARVVFSDLEAPADIGYDGKRGLLLIPLFRDDRVVAREI